MTTKMSESFQLTESECAVLEDLFEICGKDTGNYLVSLTISREQGKSFIVPVIQRNIN